MSNLQAVHENETFVIDVGSMEDGSTGYVVRNKATEVAEAFEKQLHNAIMFAEQANAFLINEQWRWVRIQGAKSKEELDKESAVITFDAEEDLLTPDA